MSIGARHKPQRTAGVMEFRLNCLTRSHRASGPQVVTRIFYTSSANAESYIYATPFMFRAIIGVV